MTALAPNMPAKTNYEVTNHVGTLVFTSDDLKIAKAWVQRNKDVLPGLKVEEVFVSVTRRRVYVPRPALKVVT